MVVAVLGRVTGRVTGRIFAAALVLLPVLVVAGCGSPSDAGALDLPADAKVVYRFNDSSVPPPYHRSFELTITSSSITDYRARLVVDSYGEILADVETAEVSQTWQELTKTYPVLDALPVVKSEIGCAGGTSRSLTITVGEKVLQEIFIDECGGVNESASAVIVGWVEPALKLFPPIDELAPS